MMWRENNTWINNWSYCPGFVFTSSPQVHLSPPYHFMLFLRLYFKAHLILDLFTATSSVMFPFPRLNTSLARCSYALSTFPANKYIITRWHVDLDADLCTSLIEISRPTRQCGQILQMVIETRGVFIANFFTSL